jgi:hypothetical protein
VAGFEKIIRISQLEGKLGNVQADEDPRFIGWSRTDYSPGFGMEPLSGSYSALHTTLRSKPLLGSSPFSRSCIFGSVTSRHGIVINIESEEVDWLVERWHYAHERFWIWDWWDMMVLILCIEAILLHFIWYSQSLAHPAVEAE